MAPDLQSYKRKLSHLIVDLCQAGRLQSNRGFYCALITNALSQRCEIVVRQGHSDAWAARPSPEIANHTADETLSKTIDLDAHHIAVRAGHARFFRFGGFPKHLDLAFSKLPS